VIDLVSDNGGVWLCDGEGDGGRGADPPEGGRRDGGPFRSQSDITVGPYRASIAIDTGEATIVYNPPRVQGNSWVPFDDEWDALVSVDGDVLSKRPSLSIEERASKNLERANKRARVALRRYCIKNELQKMLTFTYAEPAWNRGEVKHDMNQLFVRWRHLKHDKAFPYAYVLELHPMGHGLHVHAAVPLHFIDKHWLQETWGFGIVHYRDPKPLRETSSRERSRRLSGYLAKYVSKDLSKDRALNEQRYSVAQNFNVQIKRASFSSLVKAIEWIFGAKDELFEQVWSYNDDIDWDGPPVWVFRSPGNEKGG